jgi:hypothetical protein
MFNLNLIVVDVIAIVIHEINFFIHETDESILSSRKHNFTTYIRICIHVIVLNY